MKTNISELRRKLCAEIEPLCRWLFPGGRFSEDHCGWEARLNGNRIRIILYGPRAGNWQATSARASGDVLVLVHRALRCQKESAIELARCWLEARAQTSSPDAKSHQHATST